MRCIIIAVPVYDNIARTGIDGYAAFDVDSGMAAVAIGNRGCITPCVTAASGNRSAATTHGDVAAVGGDIGTNRDGTAIVAGVGGF